MLALTLRAGLGALSLYTLVKAIHEYRRLPRAPRKPKAKAKRA